MASLAAISQIPLSSIASSNKLCWMVARNGVYSIKQGYNIVEASLKMTNFDPSPSFTITNHKWHNSGKLKQSLGLYISSGELSHAITKNEALTYRHRWHTKICPICKDDVETIERLFFSCPWTRYVWFGCGLSLRMNPMACANAC